MEKFKLSNARLLYKKSKMDSTWMQQLIELDQAIESHPRLQRTSDKFHLYFFKPSEEIKPEDEIWVAREISGFVNPGDLPGMETYDLAKGLGFGQDSLVGDTVELSELFKLEARLRKELKKELAPTWRVSYFPENGGFYQRIGLF